MTETRRSLRLWAGCGAVTGFVCGWLLMYCEPLQVLLVAPLRLVHHLSWSLTGGKIVGDGLPSTLVLSAWFALVGVMVAALVRLLWISGARLPVRPDSNETAES